MTFEVRLSDQAKQDLGDIYDYIAYCKTRLLRKNCLEDWKKPF